MTQRRGQLDIVVVGPYPPPLGGVSSHVKRLSTVLEERGVRVGVLNHFGHTQGSNVIGALHRNPLLYWRAVRRLSAPLVHYHHARFDTLIAVALARRRTGTSYVATIHGHGLSRSLRLPVLGRLARWALRRFDEIVAVSPEIARSIASAVGQPAVTIVPAYVPGEEEGHAPSEVQRFLGRPGRTLVVSAYRVKSSNNGGDPYGLDLAVDAFLDLGPRHPDVRLAVFLAQGARGRRERRYMDGLLSRVREAGLTDRVALYVGLDLAPAFRHDVIYLRPSRTDGDAVSIREALDAGTPVLASDVVRRPAGTQVVDGHWPAAIERELLREASSAPARLPHDHVEALLDLYARRLPAMGLRSRPRIAIVSWNAEQPFSPRGERTRALAEALRADWDVEILGGAPAPVGSMISAGARPSTLRRRARALAELFLLDKHELWSRARFRRWRPDVDAALLIGYPFSPVSEAARRLTAARIPYIVDAGDPWVLTGPGQNRFVGRRRAAGAEHRLWAGAAGAVVTTRGQARPLSALFPGLRVLTRPNGYQPVPAPEASASPGSGTGGTLRLVHFGNLYAARLDVGGFLEALKATGPWEEISLTLYGRDWTGMLRHPPADVTVSCAAPLPWNEVVRAASGFDLALVLGNLNPAQLPSKAIQYLTLPIPRLALVRDVAEPSALGEYVSDKPGWLVMGLDTPGPGARVAHHLSTARTPEALRAPAAEAWPAVARQIVDFMENCLDRIPPSSAAPPAAADQGKVGTR